MHYSVRKAIALGTFWATCLSAHAGVVVANFDGLASGGYFHNLLVEGFTVSPSCHVDIGVFSGATQVAGWDTSGCISGGNLGYLGLPPPSGLSPASLYVSLAGQPFTFSGFALEAGRVTVRSSQGALATFSNFFNSPSQISLTGAEWSDIAWIQFDNDCAGTPCTRVDDLTFVVPEPATLPLVALAGGLLLASRRRGAGRSTRRR